MKLDAKELRIGNYIETKHGIQQVTQIEENRVLTRLPPCTWSMINFHYEDVNPITLDEEWLIKLGFTKIAYNVYDLDLTSKLLLRFSNCATENESVFLVEGNGFRVASQDIIGLRSFETKGYTFVHELQNIVKAISGYDLTIS